MSSRFVRGWKASPHKLRALVGTRLVSPAKVLTSKANARVRTDVFMTLGEGDDLEAMAEGRFLATEALTSLLHGPLDDSQHFGRVLELLLNHVARPLPGELELGLTYHLPTDSPGCWNPLLRTLKLPTLAKWWAAENFVFPSKGADWWPTWTAFDPKVLTAISNELAPLTRKALEKLPAAKLTDEPANAAAVRDELWAGLKALRGWVTTARARERTERLGLATDDNWLILSMDGDQ